MAALEPVPSTQEQADNRSATWQEFQWIYRFALAANLEMQFHPVCSRGSHLGNTLPCLDLLPLPNQKPTVMSVCADVGVAVFDDDQLAVAP